MQAATVSEVIHPETGKLIGIEIVTNIGKVYFLANVLAYEDLRVGAFPNGNFNGQYGIPFPRREIARLEPELS